MADPEVDLFAGMKKKKKKQVVLDVEDTSPALPPVADAKPAPAPAPAPTPVPEPEVEAEAPKPAAAPPAVEDQPAAEAVESTDGEAAPAGDEMDMFADLKKKPKKKKKEIPLDLDSADPAASATTPAPTTTIDGLDVPMKKKKSKKQASDFAKELDEMDAEQEEEASGGVGAGAIAGGDGDEDLGDDPFEKSNGAGESTETGKEAWVLEGREPTYAELLKRFFTLLHQHNPELAGEKRRYTIVPPQVAREGTKKTVFANISDICRRMHRQPEHVIQFLYSELGTQGSVDGAQRLIMKGRYTQKQIENMLRKYISEYVTCKICKSPDTLLGKENRLYFISCEACGSRRSVSAIKAGYQAQIGKRIKAP